ncbi:hypothetical protein [Vibrio parahaemolyticus]|uniref:J domain-containing protein n=1 Tax=Vibrio parahaemolyticus TaxID=670 RepID=A0A7Y0SBC0_VIBPH|nr:hypothetical protein [Vibrio parahaemolyticus]EHC7287597.1 hypothetical protein [Vibrio parahaemolyticus]EJE4146497.1 hypothetical protein [Vibrio parahaemolyticus]ELU0548838.1 hypothetical protein [Vibrio parahaemolyticus]MCZ5858305.1 hypothetical protein [Vibrio parahaemolyticus]MCZ6277636.1 hypothetical protein [Vibrio parahaemolyticus]
MKFITTLSILLIAASSLAVTGQAHASISGTSQGSTSRSEAIEYGWQPYEVNETADLINCVLLYDYVLEQYPSDKEIRGVAKARLDHLLDHYEYENRPEIYSADYIDSQKILLRNNFVDTTPEDRDRLLAIADQCSHRFANTLESDPFGKPITDLIKVDIIDNNIKVRSMDDNAPVVIAILAATGIAFIFIVLYYANTQKSADTEAESDSEPAAEPETQEESLDMMYKLRVLSLETRITSLENRLDRANGVIRQANKRIIDLKQELKDRPTITVTVTEPSNGFNFFTPFKTEEQLKKAYKSLSLAYHPDRGGDTEIMKELNDQYKAASAN